MEGTVRRGVSIPQYTLGEELFNSVSHGVGALLGIAALVLMLLRAQGALSLVTAAFFGAAMILLYTVSCLYHALSPRLTGKKVLRVVDHCNVFLLVFGTYVPFALLGVGGVAGRTLLAAVGFFNVLGIVLTALDLEKYQTAAVVCHLLSGWSILLGIPGLLRNMDGGGLVCMILGGVMYSVGAVLYSSGKKKKYRHSVFHIFCLLGTFFHFWTVYRFLL